MWNFNKCNFKQYCDKLSQYNWEICFESNDIDIINENITKNILDAAKATIPNRTVTIRPNDKPWFNNHLRQRQRKMLRYFQIAKKTQDPVKWESFRKLRKSYNEEILLAKNEYEHEKHKYLESNSTNPKKWWSLLKNVYKNDDFIESIPPIETDNGILVDDLGKAEAFNLYFLQASHLDDSEAVLPEHPRLINIVQGLNDIIISRQDVADQVSSLDCSKSYGPDCISPIFLKEGGDIIIDLLYRLYSLSLLQAKVPRDFKMANVVLKTYRLPEVAV